MGPARPHGPGPGAGVRASLAAVLLGVVMPASAKAPAPAATVLYRCTSAEGAVALQNAPCPRGQRQELREIAAFAAAPATRSPPPSGIETTTAIPRAEATPAAITAGEAAPPPRRMLPPPLWRCTDLNGRSRLADTYDPQPRCVPLSVLGVDLSRAPPAAATLCRTVEDECVELVGDAACAAWEERLDAAESALRHAFSDTQAERRRERDRAKGVVDSDCAD